MLHEISNYAMDSDANFYEDDVEEDRKMLRTMEEFFTKKQSNGIRAQRL